MLKAKERLAAAEVRAILKSGSTLRSGALLGKYVPARSRGAAAVVSKKVAGSAIERNRIRRSVYRALATSLPSRVHLVVMVQKRLDDYSSDIETLCSKLS